MTFAQQVVQHLELFQCLPALTGDVVRAGDKIADCLKRGGRVYLCGNGGSAAAAQHIAAELTGRFVKDRKPLSAIALSTDTSALTAIANDYGYEQVFARQVLAHGSAWDCLVVLSTSGNSPSVVEAAKAAKTIIGVGMPVIGLLGHDGGKVRELCDMTILVPSDVTARIQEAHEFIGHALCAHIETALGL